MSLYSQNIKAAHGFTWTKGKDEVFHLTLRGFTAAFVVTEKQAAYSQQFFSWLGFVFVFKS